MDSITEEYNAIIGNYEKFLRAVTSTVEELLLDNKIPVAFNIYGRSKPLKSVREKIASRRVNIKKSITELEDFVGLRIVVLFPEYKEKCASLLTETFDCKRKPDIKQKDFDKFGYNSIHLITKIKEEWTKAPNWKSHIDKKIEIQVRTLSEHIWAETSHSLFYKREENIPKIIRRDLIKAAALLEIVDENLQKIKDQVTTHFDVIAKCEYKDILNLDLYAETFRRVMLENSNGVYNLDDYENRELSSTVEKNYNILTTAALDDLIKGKINLNSITSEAYATRVLQLLDEEKQKIDHKQSKNRKLTINKNIPGNDIH